MTTKTKSKLLSIGAYTIFILLAASVLAVTMYVVVNFVSQTEEPQINEPVGDVGKVDDVIKPTTQQNPKNTDAPKPTTPDDTDPPAPADTDKSTAAEPTVFYFPVAGTLAKEYSADMPVFSITMNDYRVHNGVDFAADAGEDVLCAADGTVTEVYEDAFMGRCVTVDHGNGLCTHYMNLQTELPDGIEKGKAVKAGQVIGGVGETALCEIADEPHLHFAVTVNGQFADPFGYLPELPASMLSEDAVE